MELNKKNTLIVISLIVLFGFFLRVYMLGVPEMWFDETISSLAAKKIVETGTPTLDSGIFYGRALVFHYFTAVFMIIFHGDFGARFFSVIIGVATIILAYFIGKEYDDDKKSTGLLAALFTSVFFLEVIYSRQARFYQFFQFMLFLTIFFLYKSQYKKKYAYLAGVSALILVETHIAGLVVMPFMLYYFYKEHHSWKPLLLPILIILYWGSSIFYVPYGGKVLASIYAGNYSTALYAKIGAFSIISLFGLPLAFKKNKRMTLLIGIPSLLLFIAIFFVKLYAIRYVYFIIFPIIIFMAILFSFIYENNKLFFIIVIIFALVYPSNLFLDNNLIVLKPEVTSSASLTEPVIPYKSISPQTAELIKKSTIVAISTPGVAYYYKNPSYYIPFSLDNINDRAGNDPYTNATEFNLNNPQISFVLFQDTFGYERLNDEQTKKLDAITGKCTLIEENIALKIYKC